MAEQVTVNQYRGPDDLQAWSQLQPETAIEPDLPIVDSHHHLWNHERGRYFLSDFENALRKIHNIKATVFVECSSEYRTTGPEAMRPVGETEFVAKLTSDSANASSGATRVAAGIVSFADLRLGEDVGTVLDAHIAAGDSRFHGIRHAVPWDPVIGKYAYRNSPPGLLGDATYRAGVAEMEARNLSFEAWVYHRQIPEVLELARAFPGLTIILNHLGGLLNIGSYREKAAEEFALWQRYMRELASAENVVVKIGGLGMLTFGFETHLQPAPPDSSVLQKKWGR